MTRQTFFLGAKMAAGLVALALATYGYLELFEPGSYYQWKQERMVKRVLAANPHELLAAARQMLQIRPVLIGEIRPSDAVVPNAIRKLGPTRIKIAANYVSVDFSDIFNPFGIVVYADGLSPAPLAYGRGPCEWITGLWVYDDGQLRRYARSLPPVKWNQPVNVKRNDARSTPNPAS